MPKTKANSNRWPVGAVVYQIYPRSFYDSNDDGIGDLPGIIKKLDYIKDLGANVIWLSPFYPSPMADFGYDVADYCDVDPIFGNLEDMRTLIHDAHKLDIKVIVDLVANHTSDEHSWFRQSKQSPTNQYSDFYVWRDAKHISASGVPTPPNNWVNIFNGESAWEWEPSRQQFYLHTFDIRQPELDWSNPEVRNAIKDVMRFWLDMGVDGFRVDAVQFLAKDPHYRDEPRNPHHKGHRPSYDALKHTYSRDWPLMYSYLAEIAKVLKEKPYQDSLRFMITEAYPNKHPVEEYLVYYKEMDPEVAAPFIFEGISLPWQAEDWHAFLHKFHDALDAFSPLAVASYAFGNHDKPRLASRRGQSAARSAAVLLLTLPGMAFIYNGDEIGMEDGDIPLEYIQDPSAKGGFGRDPERTPLQWSAESNAGFTKAEKPWLPIADNYKEINVENQNQSSESILSLYKELTELRQKNSAIRQGSFSLVTTHNEHVLGYIRSDENESFLILINFSNRKANCQPKLTPKSLVISSDAKTKLRNITSDEIELLGHEAAIFKV